MTKQNNKAVNVDLNNIDLPFDTEDTPVEGKKTYDKPANRWLNISFVLRAGEKTRKLNLPFGLILDSLEERLAEGISEGKLSQREISEQQALLKILDKTFKEMPAGSSKTIELEGRLSKPADSTEESNVEEEDWSL